MGKLSTTMILPGRCAVGLDLPELDWGEARGPGSEERGVRRSGDRRSRGRGSKEFADQAIGGTGIRLGRCTVGLDFAGAGLGKAAWAGIGRARSLPIRRSAGPGSEE
jgi:hypothetical protein